MIHLSASNADEVLDLLQKLLTKTLYPYAPRGASEAVSEHMAHIRAWKGFDTITNFGTIPELQKTIIQIEITPLAHRAQEVKQ